MPLKFTGGGSLTFSVAVLVAAWTIRALRDKRRRSSSTAAPAEGSAKYLSELSLEALSLLVHLEALPYCFIDVRPTEVAEAAPLAAWVSPAVNIPEPQLQSGLKQRAAWQAFAAASPNAAPSAADNTTTSSTTAAHESSTEAPFVDVPQWQREQQQQQQQQAEGLPLPTRRHLLVLIADSEQQQRAAVSRAAAAGFDRVAVPACDIQQLLQVHLPNSPISRDQQVAAAAAAAAAQFPTIHADALAVLLGVVPLPEGVWQLFSQQGLVNPASLSQQQQPTAAAGGGRSPGHTLNNSGSSGLPLAGDAPGEGPAAAAGRRQSLQQQQQQQQQQRLLLLDVRRHDERTLYGAIPGAHHIPADELSSALQLAPGPFRRRYHFDPPVPGLDVLVLHSRCSARAQWAAQLCLDAGCKYVFVYPEGVLGWGFGPGVNAYAPYQQGDAPPEPLAQCLREPDVALGVMEVQQLGLVGLLMQQHGVTGG